MMIDQVVGRGRAGLVVGLAVCLAGIGLGLPGCGGRGLTLPDDEDEPSAAKAPASRLRASRSEPDVRDGDRVYAVAFGDEQLLEIDPKTGKVKPVGNVGLRIGDVEDIVIDPDDPDRAIGVYWEGFPGLLSIDLRTGRGTRGPKISGQGLVDKTFIEAIAMIDGVLFGSASSQDSYCPDCADRLVRIDRNSGKAVIIGEFGPQFRNIEAMAYSPKYGLIGADIGTLLTADFKVFNTHPVLVRIDPRSGRAIKIGNLPPTLTKVISNPNNTWLSPEGPFVCGLSFAPDDTLYAATIPTHFGGISELFVIDPTDASIRKRDLLNALNVDGILYSRPQPGRRPPAVPEATK